MFAGSFLFFIMFILTNLKCLPFSNMIINFDTPCAIGLFVF